MKASTLIRLVEGAGGRFVVNGRKVAAVRVPVQFHTKLRKLQYLVRAEILEREASRKWEASGRNPRWWCEQ